MFRVYQDSHIGFYTFTKDIKIPKKESEFQQQLLLL